MTTLEMLHEIERRAASYDIHYCRAGVGFIFYEGPAEHGPGDDWKQHLIVRDYYPTFEEAVEAEYQRLVAGTGEKGAG